MAPQSRKSICWQFFESRDHKTACCRKCGDTVVHHGNTTNLTRHLKKRHANFYEAALKANNSGGEVTNINLEKERDEDDPDIPDSVEIENNATATETNQNAQVTIKVLIVIIEAYFCTS